MIFLRSFGFWPFIVTGKETQGAARGGQPAEDLYFAFSSFKDRKQFKKPQFSLFEASQLCSNKEVHICLQDMHFPQQMGLN